MPRMRKGPVDAARAFYAAIFGDDGAEIVQLPEQAAARPTCVVLVQDSGFLLFATAQRT